MNDLFVIGAFGEVELSIINKAKQGRRELYSNIGLLRNKYGGMFICTEDLQEHLSCILEGAGVMERLY